MKFLVYILGILCLVIVSCQENERLLFDDADTAINFNFRKGVGIRDTTYSYNFAFLNNEETTIDLNFALQGIPVDYDRPFKLIIVETDTINNAIEGVHFSIDRDKLFMPANEVFTSVPITFYSTKDLLDTMATVQLRLEENEYLLKGAYETSLVDITVNNNFKIIPPFWRLWGLNVTYYGGFGRSDEIIIRKFCELGQITDPLWYPSPRTMVNIITERTKKWFNDNPTPGDDGEIIVFD